MFIFHFILYKIYSFNTGLDQGAVPDLVLVHALDLQLDQNLDPDHVLDPAVEAKAEVEVEVGVRIEELQEALGVKE